jgi:hypothetical protein
MHPSKNPFRHMRWHELQHAVWDTHAIIIGKGPSLDAWLAAGRPNPHDAVIIGINHATALHPCHFGVTTHPEHEAFGDIETLWCVSLPIGGPSAQLTPQSLRKPAWAAHWFLHTTASLADRDLLLQQDRSQIADQHTLWCNSSSAHPAIHLAWYLGCDQITLVGLDGGHGYAQAVQQTTSPPAHPKGYLGTRRDTDRACERLFGTRWQHWAQP